MILTTSFDMISPMPYCPHDHCQQFQIFFLSHEHRKLSHREEKDCVKRNKNVGLEFHKPESSEHSQSACRKFFEGCLHCSQLSSDRIFLHIKFFLTGIASLQERHMKFFTLLGTKSSQIIFQTRLL